MQLAALRAVAPKAEAKSKAKSLCKRPGTKGSLKRPAAAVAPTGCSEPKRSAAAEPKGHSKTSTGCRISARPKTQPKGTQEVTATASLA